MPSQYMLLLLGPFTCGLSWIFIPILWFQGVSFPRPSTRRKGLDTGCTPPRPAEPEAVAPAPLPSAPSTAWAYSPRNLSGLSPVVTTQFRRCKPD